MLLVHVTLNTANINKDWKLESENLFLTNYDSKIMKLFKNSSEAEIPGPIVGLQVSEKA